MNPSQENERVMSESRDTMRGTNQPGGAASARTPRTLAPGSASAAGSAPAHPNQGTAGLDAAGNARVDPRRLTDLPPPPTSHKADPRFATPERKAELAKAFLTQGEDYDYLRPAYPAQIVQRMIDACDPDLPHAVDLGAGTGKLALDLARSSLAVTALDPSESMLATARERWSEGAGATVGPGEFATRVAEAEHTGLPPQSAGLVTAAQAWHWFDPHAASREAARILTPGGTLALVWNTLDVSIPWVHRYSRIAHAGDIQRENFMPTVGEPVEFVERIVTHWEDHRTTWDFVNLAKTRSYTITATPERRTKVLDNLDWYLHEHQGHEPGSIIAMPYRTDLFLYRPR